LSVVDHYCIEICVYNFLLKNGHVEKIVLNEPLYLFFEKAVFIWRHWLE